MKGVNHKREIKGFWWSPDCPDQRWFGVLNLDGDPRLEVFSEDSASKEATGKVRPAIYGRDEHGKPVTLLFASTSSSSHSWGVGQTPMVNRSFHAGYALLGIEVPDAKSFLAHELIVQTQHLFGWLDISGFVNDTKQSPEETVIHYRQQEEQKVTIDSGLEVGIRVGGSSKSEDREQSIKENAFFFFRSSTGFSLRRCLDPVNALRALLHYAVLQPVYPVEMFVLNDHHGDRFGDIFIHREIEVCSSILREEKNEESLSPWWVFHYKGVRQHFAEFFGRWLSYMEQYDEALSCYAATVYHSLPEPMDHLCLTQALEAYHGVKFQSHRTRDFKSKVEEIASTHAAPLRGLVDDIPAFADEVLATRNYYTHHNPHWLTTGKVAQGEQLIRMNEKLRLLFQMCVLADNGISANRFDRLRRQLATVLVSYDM